MTFDEVLDQVRELLRQRGRVTYRALKRRFDLEDAYLEDLKGELISAERVAADEDGEVLVWTGAAPVPSSEFQVPRSSQPPASQTADAGLRTLDFKPQTLDARRDAGERRQLTVMFIDLVGSTTLSQQLDPEDYHGRVVAYQAACRQVIARYDGHIAQYLGDGALVYFGYPAAHDEDAVRAVRSGLEIVAAVSQLAYTPPLQVRIGVHTGPVVAGVIGTRKFIYDLWGDTVNTASRMESQGASGTIQVTSVTYERLRDRYTFERRGTVLVKGKGEMVTYLLVGRR